MITKIFIIVTTLLAVMNPFGNVPLFVSMTENLSKKMRSKLFDLIVYTGFSIVILFGLLGDILLKYFFKVEMMQIKVAGGLILIVVAIKSLLTPKEKKEKKSSNNALESEEEILQQGIIPMAFPILVGPGTMTTILIIKKESGSLYVILATFIAFIIIKILLTYSHIIEKVLGKLVLYILSRVMQIFIIATGVKMIVAGIFEIIKSYH
ncbi:MAG: multiple antibiotic resistance protein [Fusobacteriaceae bacterium]|nr:multiple antibiotic resistance protein [Fusobacteriaceae bacterium]